MKSWLLNVTITVLIVSLISLILPDGKISKYVKSIFPLVIMIVVVQPLTQLKNSNFEFIDVDFSVNTTYQEDYLQYITYENIKTKQQECENIIEGFGVKNPKVSIEFSIEDYNAQITKVLVNLKESVIISDKEHIDIIREVKNALADYLSIGESLVVVYE